MKNPLSLFSKQTDLLIVGHYTHDVLINDQHTSFQRLGGGVAYASVVAAGLNQKFKIISKVGSDFSYAGQCQQLPTVLTQHKTTSFIKYTSEVPRRHHVNTRCEAIYPDDIHDAAHITLVCGVIGEILPKTIKRLYEKSVVLIGDVQGFIRQVDASGKVSHIHLDDTEYADTLPLFDYLKVSDEELPYVNVSTLRKATTLLVTYGDNGCTVYQRNNQFHVPSYAITAVDSTGAGDSFLTGFAIGIQQRLSLEEAVCLGHRCGRIAVQSIGIPTVDSFSHLSQECIPDEGLRLQQVNFK